MSFAFFAFFLPLPLLPLPRFFDFAGFAAAGATLLSPFPGEGRPGVKVGLRARAAQ